jgi:hypothetical protein
MMIRNLFPENLTSLKGMSIAKAFFHYYVDNLPECEKSNQRFMYSDIRKTVEFMKTLIAQEIPSRPCDGNGLANWISRVDNIAGEAQSAVKSL